MTAGVDIEPARVRSVTGDDCGYIYYGCIMQRWYGEYRRTEYGPWEQRYGPTRHEGFKTKAEAEESVRRCFEQQAAL